MTDLPWWADDFLRAARTLPGGSSRGAVTIQPGLAEVHVEGRGFRRTRATVRAPALRDDQWDAFYRLLEEQALLPAALLAGYLPRDGRQLLAARGVRLAPPARSVETRAADEEGAATAVRAVAASFADDPLALLHFRGRSPDRVRAHIETAWAAAGEGSMSLAELEALLAPAPSGGGLLPAVQQADAFRDTRVARAGLARLFGKVSERVAVLNRIAAG